MDRKTRKKIDTLNQKLQRLQQQLAGARRQDDEPGEVARLEREIASAKQELEKIKGS
jgi:prefoldin subunit 5